MTRRVVITGMGTINALGFDVPTYWKALVAGKSGVSNIEQFDTTAYKVHFGGEVKNFDAEKLLDGENPRRLDRFAQFGLAAAVLAVKDCGIDFKKEDPFRCGVVLGSGIGGLTEFETQHSRLVHEGPDKVSPFIITKMIANSASGIISIHFGLRGHNTTVATACSSAAHALGDSLRTIQLGHADVMVSGGAEATMTPMGVAGFSNMKALSRRNNEPQRASRPFDKDRDGFVLAEGAGILILEELEHAKKRGATIYAELLGVGSTADAHHITSPHPDGAGAGRSMQMALKDAHLDPQDIQYINAHGTSTPQGDIAETKAMKAVFGSHAKKLAVSSTKSILGHTLGASGGIELIATIMSIRTGVVHPTINLDNPDPVCDLDYVPHTAREMPVRFALSNSFGFGGHNCTLAVGALR